jgi:hypothetical protein
VSPRAAWLRRAAARPCAHHIRPRPSVVCYFQLYGKHGVAEYCIAGPERASVEVFRLGETGLEAVAALGTADTLTTPLLPGFSVPLSVVFDFGLLES